jgi:regulator of protease activity HflC (stomatin/prohibitin superfamily)
MAEETIMAELNMQQSMDFIANDLNTRAQASDNMNAQLNAMPAAEQREAYAAMTGGSGSSSAVPELKLVNGDGKDALHPAEIEVGGYNAVIGVKVPAQAEGVLTMIGSVYDKPLEPGWHWKTPLHHVYMMPTNLIANTVRAQAGSHDLQQVTTELTIPFHLQKGFGPKVYSKIGTLEKVEAVVINPGVLESLKAVCAQYTAEELITKRAEVKEKVESKLKQYIHTALEERGLDGAIQIGNLAITHFEFSDGYNKSIEAKVKAAQDALRAESEKKQRVTEAEGIRDAVKAKADGDAYATDVRSKAEALAIQRKADALKANPNLIDLNAVDKWDGKLPQYTGGPTPFIKVPDMKSPAPAEAPEEQDTKKH